MKQVLFLQDKWCNSNPNFGINSHFQNVHDTFVQYALNSNTHTLFYDESIYCYGVHIDKILLQYCLQFNIETVFLTFSGQSPANPSKDIIKKLKDKGIFICVFWPDNNPLDLVLRKGIDDIVDLHIPHDNPKSNTHQVRFEDSKHLYLWTPINKYLFRPDNQSIDVSFIGSSRYPERQIYLNQLAEKIHNIIINGGQRESGLSYEAYATFLRKSKININFARNPMGQGYEQLKGRVFETISSSSLLLEEKNSSTSDFFTPGLDYIEFENLEDLLNKIKYYSENESDRISIAENGCRKHNKFYTSNHFWDRVMTKIYELKR